MDSKQKEKFRALSKLSKEKQVPSGWVYVGNGVPGDNTSDLGFGPKLRMRHNCYTQKHDWSDTYYCFRGNSKKDEYAVLEEIWNKVVEPDNQGIIALSKQTFSMGCPAETVYIGYDPVEPCFEFTEGHYCMDRRIWEEQFGSFSQPLPDSFTIRTHNPEISYFVRQHLAYLGYGVPTGIPDSFVCYDDGLLFYSNKSGAIPIPMELLIDAEPLKEIRIQELDMIIRGDVVRVGDETFRLSALINKLKENDYEL